MKTKKIISILLTVLLMFSFCSFSVYAIDGSGETPLTDFSVNASVTQEISGETVTTNCTSDLVISDVTSGIFKGLKKYAFPTTVDGITHTTITLKFADHFTFRTEHEYNLKFKYGYSTGTACTMKVSLYVRDTSGALVKTQNIYSISSPGNGKVHSVDFNFVPAFPELDSGYTCNMVIEFTQQSFTSSSGSLQSFYISDTIELNDLDDNSGLINSIIDAIKAIPEKIKGFFTDLANSIGNFFTELANNIKGFFDSLKNYILYFQDPVTLNEDGVLVDANGNPIYVNPFENSIESIEETFNGWIEDIRSFISGMDESRVEVSGYLQTGTGLINDILSASPIISAVLIFIASFFVIRKVVGR